MAMDGVPPDQGLIDRLDLARTTASVGRILFEGLTPYGVRGLFAGSFPILPPAALGDIVAGAVVYAQISPQGWQSSYSRQGLDEGNPVILALGRTISPFRWSEGGVDALKGWKGLDLARQLGVEDGLAVPCREPGGREGVVSMAFERFAFSSRELRAIQFAALVAHERIVVLSAGQTRPSQPLTPRERDCLAFVADGRADAYIADKLGVSPTTIHSHIENAKRKLGARTRAQAVARLFARGLF